MNFSTTPSARVELPVPTGAEVAPLAAPIPYGFAQAMTDGYLLVGSDGMVRTANRAAARLLGHERIEGESVERIFRDSPELLDVKGSSSGDRLLLQPAEDSFMNEPIEVTVVAREDESGFCDWLLQGAAFRTSRERRLFYQASHDHLTGFCNRRMFEEQLGQAITASGPAQQVSLLLVEVEGIQAVARGEGRTAGENLLLAVANHLDLEVCAGQHLSRLGDYQFGVILHDTSASLAVLTAERLVNAAESASTPESPEYGGVSAVAGVAVFPEAARTALSLIRAADHALCRAQEGGCSYSVASPTPCDR